MVMKISSISVPYSVRLSSISAQPNTVFQWFLDALRGETHMREDTARKVEERRVGHAAEPEQR